MCDFSFSTFIAGGGNIPTQQSPVQQQYDMNATVQMQRNQIQAGMKSLPQTTNVYSDSIDCNSNVSVFD